jgi:hypothetical protein
MSRCPPGPAHAARGKPITCRLRSPPLHLVANVPTDGLLGATDGLLRLLYPPARGLGEAEQPPEGQKEHYRENQEAHGLSCRMRDANRPRDQATVTLWCAGQCSALVTLGLPGCNRTRSIFYTEGSHGLRLVAPLVRAEAAPGDDARRNGMKRVLTLAMGLTLVGVPILAAVQTDRGSDAVEMIAIAGGHFLMGSDAADSNADERPAAPIMVTDFLIDRVEVTNRRYRVCVEAGACPGQSPRTTLTSPSWRRHSADSRTAGLRDDSRRSFVATAAARVRPRAVGLEERPGRQGMAVRRRANAGRGPLRPGKPLPSREGRGSPAAACSRP